MAKPIDISALATELRSLVGRLKRRLREQGSVGDLTPSQIAALQPLLDRAQPQRIWLLYLPVMDPHGLLMAKLTELYPQVTSRHYAYCDIYLFAPAAK